MTHVRRGALIVIEGVDFVGKSTQARLCLENLLKQGVRAELLRFPDRSTEIGVVINRHLRKELSMNPRMIHLLFSANRWEAYEKMVDKLNGGITLILDRYAFSGVAYSVAKGLSRKWCMTCDAGLVKPDQIFFFKPGAVRLNRDGEKEIFEVEEFQAKVMNEFEKLATEDWKIIKCDRSIEEINQSLMNDVLNVVKSVNLGKLEKLWDHLL